MTAPSLFERQILMAAKVAPLANLLHAGAIIFVGATILPWSTAARWTWTSAGVLVCLSTLRWRSSQTRVRTAYLEMLAASVLFGLLWGAGLAGVFAGSTRERQLLLSCVVVGVLGAGAIALSAHHSLGWTWLAAIAPPMAVVVLSHPDRVGMGILVMLTVYVFVLTVAVHRLSRSFRARCRAEEVAEQRRADIQLRLDDFEAGSRDWLWETAPDGRFVRISERFCSFAGRTDQQLSSATLPGLLRSARPDADRRTDEVELVRLDECLRTGTGFTDVTVEVVIDGVRRWWTFSGRRHGDGWRGVGSDVTDSVRARERILRLATTDPVTGLPNRHALGRRLAERLALVGPGRSLHLAIVDIDHFKTVNDTLGHPVGDLLVAEIARTLSAALLDGEFCARFGGDEFVVLLEGSDRAGAALRFQELHRAIRGRQYVVADNPLEITGSVGFCSCDDPTTDPATVISSADLALYAAKSAGRDRVCAWTAELSDAASERAAIVQELRQAVPLHELELHWQPQIDLATSHIWGWEALVRWHHPRLGLVSPGRFLQVATETGDIVDIGRHVVEMAVKAVTIFPTTQRLSLNVSSRELLAPDYVGHLVSLVAASGVDPGRFVIEVTEDVIVSESARQALLALRRAGFALSMDDFGTGYSSFSLLAAIRFDEIKIDRSFVRSLATDPVRRSLVRSIISMAAALGSTVVAEGVETAEERDLLTDMGCHRIQGYLESRPVPLGEVQDVVRSRRRPARPQRERGRRRPKRTRTEPSARTAAPTTPAVTTAGEAPVAANLPAPAASDDGTVRADHRSSATAVVTAVGSTEAVVDATATVVGSAGWVVETVGAADVADPEAEEDTAMVVD